MKTDDKAMDKRQDGYPSDASKNIRRSLPSDFTIGGPFSAFSGIINSSTSASKSSISASSLKQEILHHRPVSPPLRTPFSGHLLPTATFFSGQHPDSMSDIPIAPAFAQIFQRRRRRENRPRRQRTTFTSEQTLKLELEYNRADYITRPRRFELAEMLNLSESQIKIWFQNRRAKDKRIEKAHMDHQLRTMGYNNMPGILPVPYPCQSMCSTCAVPTVSLPVPVTPLLFNSATNKTLKIL